MKKKWLISLALVYVVGFATYTVLSSNSFGPGGDRTGSPFSSPLACGQCHGGNSNPGAGMSLSGLPTAYYPGQTYSLTLSINNPTNTNGFQITSLDASNGAAGSFASGAGSNSYTSGGRSYLEHNSPSNSGSWTFNWTAPSTNAGTVTFYASGNAANGNGNTSGDVIYKQEFNLAGTNAIALNNQSSSNPLCSSSCDGSIDFTPTGGAGGYTYNWNNGLGNTAPPLSNLCANTYAVTVSDLDGNDEVFSFNITAPQAIANQENIIAATCASNDGEIALSTTGGTGSYSYSWSGPNGSFSAGSNASNLEAGNYSVTVTDLNNCQNSFNYTVSTGASGLSASFTTTPDNCNQQNGSATAQISGGSGNYSYTWSGSLSGATINNLGSGSYSVTVTDLNSQCIDSFSVNVPAAGGPELSNALVADAACADSATGSISFSFNSGQAPFTTVWIPMVNNSDTTANNLEAGVYSVTITDNNNCSTDTSFTILAPDSIEINSSVTDALCFGENSGSITTAATGGSGSFIYQWSDNSGNADLIDVMAGNYSVTVSDGTGCIEEQSFSIQEPAMAIAITNVTSVGSNGNDCTGELSVTANGGTGAYQYTWDDPNNSVDSTVSNLCPGTYSVTITDANGCAFDTLLVVEDLNVGMDESVITELKIYPNPVVNDLWLEGDLNEVSIVEVYTISGALVMSETITLSTNAESYHINTASLSRGTYLIQLSDASGTRTLSTARFVK